jgi:hypothetical protein
MLDGTLLEHAPPVAFRAIQNFTLPIIEVVEAARTHGFLLWGLVL